MKTIELDASTWKTTGDFYSAVFQTLGSPDWHGRNMDALSDSIIGGQINTVEFPFNIRITSTDSLPSEVRDLIEVLVDIIKKASVETDNPVSIEVT